MNTAIRLIDKIHEELHSAASLYDVRNTVERLVPDIETLMALSPPERAEVMNLGLASHSVNLKFVALSDAAPDLCRRENYMDQVMIQDSRDGSLLAEQSLTVSTSLEFPEHHIGTARPPTADRVPYSNTVTDVIMMVKESVDGQVRLGYSIYRGTHLPIILMDSVDDCSCLRVGNKVAIQDMVCCHGTQSSQFDMLDAGALLSYDHSGLTRRLKLPTTAALAVTHIFENTETACSGLRVITKLTGTWPARYTQNNHMIYSDPATMTGDYACMEQIGKRFEELVKDMQAAGRGLIKLVLFDTDFSNCRLRYSDTEIWIPDRGTFAAIVNIIVGYITSGEYTKITNQVNFGSILPHLVLGGCLDDVTMVVNGTTMHYQKKLSKNTAVLHYINGSKISAPDISAVISAVVCHPNDQESYDIFVSTVSKVSMKFHRAMSDGVPVKFNRNSVPAVVSSAGSETPGCEIRIPGRAGVADDTLTLKCRLRKKSGSKSEVFMLGKWRKITDFDKFVKLAGTKSLGSTYVARHKMRNFEFVDASQHAQPVLPEPPPDRRDKNKKIEYTVQNGRFIPVTPKEHKHEDTGTTEENPFSEVDFGKLNELIRRLWALDSALDRDSRFFSDAMLITVPDKRWNDENCVKCRRTQNNVDYAIALQNAVVTTAQNDRKDFYAALKRSRELLEKVMTDIGAEEVCHNGRYHYEVTGKSGIRYSVNESTAAVSANGRHICVVPASRQVGSDIVGYDYIASLLLALNNDRMTARKITTLNNVVTDSAV